MGQNVNMNEHPTFAWDREKGVPFCLCRATTIHWKTLSDIVSSEVPRHTRALTLLITFQIFCISRSPSYNTHFQRCLGVRHTTPTPRKYNLGHTIGFHFYF